MRNKWIMIVMAAGTLTLGACDQSVANRDHAGPMVILAGQIAEGSVFTGDAPAAPAPPVEVIVKRSAPVGSGAEFCGETPW